MERRQFVEGIGAVSKFFGMEWPIDAINAAYEQVSNEAVETLMAAHKRVCLEFSPKPQPPIGKITAIILDEGKKHRMNQGTRIEDQWNQQKKTGDYKSQNNQKLADQSMKLINALFDGRLNNQQYVEGMMAMDSQYPVMGWKQAASGMINHWRLSGDIAWQ